MRSALTLAHSHGQCDSSAICEAGGRFEATPYGLIVKGKRISCPPHYAPPNNDYDPPHHDYEHGFPLIRSLRASTQRSTSVLFSFVLSLLIMAGSFTTRQSKTILARSCAALTRLLRCACARVAALSRRPKPKARRRPYEYDHHYGLTLSRAKKRRASELDQRRDDLLRGCTS